MSSGIRETENGRSEDLLDNGKMKSSNDLDQYGEGQSWNEIEMNCCQWCEKYEITLPLNGDKAKY